MHFKNYLKEYQIHMEWYVFLSPETLHDIPLTPPRNVPLPSVGHTASNTNKDGVCNGSEQHKRSLEEILDLMWVQNFQWLLLWNMKCLKSTFANESDYFAILKSKYLLFSYKNEKASQGVSSMVICTALKPKENGAPFSMGVRSHENEVPCSIGTSSQMRSKM